MIKMMIVDDEPVIREGMMNIIDWENLGVEIVGTASNGRDGLAKAIDKKPDIVITDIRMPVVDGIRFSAELRDKLPKVRIVFLTGYSDFEYSRHAIRVNAADYLLKPVNTEELIDLVQRLAGEISRENCLVQDHTRKTTVLKRNLPMLRARCIRSYLEKKMAADRFLEEAGELGMELQDGGFRMVIFCIDYYYQILENGERESDILKYALSNVAEEVFEQIGKGYVCDEGDARLTILLNSKKDIGEITRAAREIQFYMRKYFSLSVSVGIGSLAEGIEDLNKSYKNADEALDERMKQGSSRIIVKESKKQVENKAEKAFITAAEEQELKDSVILLSKAMACGTIEAIFQKYVMEQNVGRREAEQLCIYLILIAMREAERNQMEPRTVLGKDYYYQKEITKYEMAEDLEMWIKDIYSHVICSLEEQKGGKYKGIVINGISFAKEHFSESIQVSDVAKAVYVTPNYFSKIFKEETGENFTDWLNKYRIEYAKKRIEKEPETKIYSIAADAGFSDYKYFAFIFKKYIGCTPTSYRNMIV